MKNENTIRINKDIIKKVKTAIRAALDYEKQTGGSRKLGITGEVGEALICYELGLSLVSNPRSEGYDAIDKKGMRVQIKTRRSESRGLPKDSGRVSSFSKHEFDYALLGLLNQDYKLCEVWRADYKELKPVIEKNKRRNPNISAFKRFDKRVYYKKN